MNRNLITSAVAALGVLTGLASSTVQAQVVVSPRPVVVTSYYTPAPAPVVTYYAPVPVVTYAAPVPVVPVTTYYAPAVTTYVPARVYRPYLLPWRNRVYVTPY
jgi:hypothetical protein